MDQICRKIGIGNGQHWYRRPQHRHQTKSSKRLAPRTALCPEAPEEHPSFLALFRYGVQRGLGRVLLIPELEAKITSDPNPSYTRSEIEVTDKVAYYLLARLKIDEADAKVWGAALREALNKAEEDLQLAR